MVVSGNMDKTIRRIIDRRQQQIETYRYWQSLPPGERLSAVCHASTDAYGFKGNSEPRASKDLDIFIRADVRNGEAVFRALGAYDAPLEGLTAENFRDEPASIFQIRNSTSARQHSSVNRWCGF
jgi:hypothetical protein